MSRKSTIMTVMALGVSSAANALMAQSVKPCIPKDPEIEDKVEKTLSEMTLDEKIGQMCELTIETVTDYDASGKENKFVVSKDVLHDMIATYKVGSFLNVPLGKAQDPQVYEQLLENIQEESMQELGIPDIYGIDHIHGTTYVDGGTLFAQPINQAASFNRDIPFEVSKICAYETKAASLPWVYTPTMDIARGSSWSRMWESYGEDPYVNGQMGAQAVRGFQGDDPNHIGPANVAACMKHYLGYGGAVNGLDRTPSSITERDMREKYFAPFLEAARAGALSVMINSAVNNGIPFHANKELITGWLKEELNWDGMVVTDWADIVNLYSRDHIAATKKDAIRIAINAGIDMSMDPYNPDFCTLLKELVEEGAVSMERIDDAVRRILRLKYRLNLFDQPTYKFADFPEFGSKAHAETALRVAEEGQVLLKNENAILPIAKDKKILVTGPNANSMRTLNGGWSYTWQGHMTDEYAQEYNTIYEALSNKYGESNVTLVEGVKYVPADGGNSNWNDDVAENIDDAVKAAAEADVIVACVGENSYCETPGNVKDLTLSANQRQLVKALAATGKPIVLILNGGRPRIIEEIEPLASAVVDIFLPGNYGGDALANLIAGDANFSAKLPITYPSKVNGFATYDYKPCENVATMSGAYNYDAKMDVQWQFGYGMSYTTYEYSNFRVNKSEFKAGDILEFSVDVTNTGNIDGKEPVLLFTSDVVASVSPDNSRLRDFEKVSLKAGETKTVTMTVKASELAFVGMDNRWTLEAGEFRVKCGDQSLMINCTETKVWDTPNIED